MKFQDNSRGKATSQMTSKCHLTHRGMLWQHSSNWTSQAWNVLGLVLSLTRQRKKYISLGPTSYLLRFIIKSPCLAQKVTYENTDRPFFVSSKLYLIKNSSKHAKRLVPHVLISRHWVQQLQPIRSINDQKKKKKFKWIESINSE